MLAIIESFAPQAFCALVGLVGVFAGAFLANRQQVVRREAEQREALADALVDLEWQLGQAGPAGDTAQPATKLAIERVAVRASRIVSPTPERDRALASLRSDDDEVRQAGLHGLRQLLVAQPTSK